MKSKIILILLACVSLQFQANAGTEGHGGDPLRILFEDARPFAADRVSKAESCAFGTNVSPEVRGWILTRKQALAEDILESAHVWITDKQSTCAFTQTTSRAGISLSFETCRPGIRDISDALKILVHESVHHFGATDENFADQVAEAIYSLGSRSTCTIPPAQDPFDPASCPGSPLSSQDVLHLIPLPNSTSKELGTFKVHSRMRTCYSESWCGSWIESDDAGLHLLSESSYSQDRPAQKEGIVSVLLSNNAPIITIETKQYGVGNNWKTMNSISNYKLDSNVVLADHLRVGVTEVIQNPFSGWVTNSCLRQSLSSKLATKDSSGNNIVREWETVILSHFLEK